MPAQPVFCKKVPITTSVLNCLSPVIYSEVCSVGIKSICGEWIVQ